MTTQITVLGAGPGGYVAAIRAAQLGANVTVIEQDNVGGTCLNRGCIPSKLMKHSAEIMENFHKSSDFGIDLNGSVAINIEKLMAKKEKVVQSLSKGILGLFDHHKITYIKGNGKVKSPNLVEVISKDGKKAEVKWDKLIIATGSEPLNISAFAFDGESILSSTNILNLKEIPKSITIVGGGVIGCEFACILSSLGSQVTIIEAMQRLLPLPSVDEDCSKVILREMKKKKIKVIVDRSVEKVEKTEDGLQILVGESPFSPKTDKVVKPQTIISEKMVVCIGRKPNTDNIGLENIGVELDDRGWIIADDHMATNVENVFAIGDVLGPLKIMLAHVASTEANIAAENAMGNNMKMQYDVVPGGIFTHPEVANVGLTESQAKDKGVNVRANSVLFRTLGKAQVIDEIAGQIKIVSDVDSNKVLGVHIVGPHATDLIAEGTLAIQKGLTAKDIAETIHAHPTLAEIMMEVSYKAIDKSLHG